MNKRGRLTISLITGIIFFLLFKGLVMGAMGNTILLGASVVYSLAILRITGKKDYAFLASGFGLSILLSVYLALNISDQHEYISFSKALAEGTFYSFVLFGTPTILIIGAIQFMMGKQTHKQNKDLLH